MHACLCRVLGGLSINGVWNLRGFKYSICCSCCPMFNKDDAPDFHIFDCNFVSLLEVWILGSQVGDPLFLVNFFIVFWCPSDLHGITLKILRAPPPPINGGASALSGLFSSMSTTQGFRSLGFLGSWCCLDLVPNFHNSFQMSKSIIWPFFLNVTR